MIVIRTLRINHATVDYDISKRDRKPVDLWTAVGVAVCCCPSFPRQIYPGNSRSWSSSLDCARFHRELRRQNVFSGFSCRGPNAGDSDWNVRNLASIVIDRFGTPLYSNYASWPLAIDRRDISRHAELFLRADRVPCLVHGEDRLLGNRY